MQPRAKVSVLIPCYNKAAYLEETLASVYAQDTSEWELIVVDDGSNDGSRAILERHASRLRAIFQANQGASAARQRALSEANGEYIQYLDADDLLLPAALSTRVSALEASAGDIAYADFQRLRRNAAGDFVRGEVTARTLEAVDPDPEIACFSAFWAPPVALMYSRRIVARIGPWNRTLPVIQDARYLFDAALAQGRFVHVPGVSALYRDDQRDSLSRQSSSAFIADVARNADQIAAIWKARGTLDRRRRRALGDCYDYVARAAFRAEPVLFGHCIKRIAALDPTRLSRWPGIAALLERTLGKQRALRVLASLGRPAQ